MDERDLQAIRTARRSGSKEAFTVLVRAYKDFVFRIAFGILRNKMDAEDVLQETFLKAYFSLSKLQEDSAFPSWLATIATRLALDFIKKKRRLDLSAVNVEEIQAERTGIDTADRKMMLEQAMSGLGPELRAALVLREVQGFDYQEIAAILDIPVGTVRSRLHAARAQMRKTLQKQGGLEGGL